MSSPRAESWLKSDGRPWPDERRSTAAGQTERVTRIVRVGAAQMGPVQREHTRGDVVERLIAMLRDAAEERCDVVVFPELALTTFFPRWFVDDIAEADHWYERSMPNAATQPLFDEATRLGVGFCLGYALLEEGSGGRTHRWNVQTLVERDGSIVGTFKKVHIPGHEHHEPDRPFQHAERYYFEPGPEGFGVWRAFGGLVGVDGCGLGCVIVVAGRAADRPRALGGRFPWVEPGQDRRSRHRDDGCAPSPSCRPSRGGDSDPGRARGSWSGDARRRRGRGRVGSRGRKT